MPPAKRIAGRAFFLLFSQWQCVILPKVGKRNAQFLGEKAVKISCKQSDLSRGLSVVSHAVATRSTLPVLTNILMSTDDNRLKLSATNLEIGITCWVAAEVIEQGSITVPARLLADFVNGLPQGVVEMSVPKGSYTLGVKSAPRFAANVKGMDAG